MRRRLLLAWLLAGCTGPLWAAQLVVRVSDTGGRAVGDAVVTLRPGTPTAGTPPAPVTRYVDQRDETFIPYVQVVRPGDRVVFRNSDGTRHHVYSFSEAKAFEFLLRPGASSPAVTLDKPGLVALGCNIHDHMVAYLLVTSERARVTPSQGQVVFEQLPPGNYTVTVWHPQLRPGQAPPAESVAVGEGTEARHADFTLSLIPDPRGFADREHLDY